MMRTWFILNIAYSGIITMTISTSIDHKVYS